MRRSKQAKFGWSSLAQQSHVELRLFLQHISAWLERVCCIIALLSHYPNIKLQNHPQVPQHGDADAWNMGKEWKGDICEKKQTSQIWSSLAQQSHVELRLFLQHISAWLERVCCIIALLSHYPNIKLQNHPQVRQHGDADAWNMGKEWKGGICEKKQTSQNWSSLAQQSHVELRLFLQHISAWLERVCCIISTIESLPQRRTAKPPASATATGC